MGYLDNLEKKMQARVNKVQQQERIWQPPKKLTEAEKQAFRESVRLRAESTAKKIPYLGILSAVLIGLSGFIYYQTDALNHSTDVKVSTINAKIASANDDRLAQESDIKNMLDSDQVGTIFTNASTMGSRIAEIQNDLRGTDNENAESVVKRDSHKAEMEKYFSKSVINSSFPVGRSWFNPYVEGELEGIPLSLDKYKWEFESNFDLPAYNQINLTWLCKDDKGQILYWVIGKYNTERGLITAVTASSTALGDKYLVTYDFCYGLSDSEYDECIAKRKEQWADKQKSKEQLTKELQDSIDELIKKGS